MLYLILISLFLPVFAQDLSPNIDPNKFTICAITINSDEEKKVFESQVKKNPKKFNPVVELTNLGDDKNWFENACASGIRCDQLIISGHFGGTFFGSSGKTLSLVEMEKAGCSKTCAGIMSNPYEVFLFGCNTLATKDKDHRTPEEYYRVLLEDGIAPAQAQMVVDSRYGALGDDNISSMKRAFDGEAKQLYGFHSVGPSGKNVEKFIKNYFAKTKPAEHLEKLQAKRMLDKVDMGNEILAKELKVTAFAQCGAGGNKDLDPKTQIICSLRDSTLSIDTKIQTAIEALNHENYLVFIPAINAFLKDHPVESFTDKQRNDFAIIKKNESIKTQISGLLEAAPPAMILEWSKFAKSLGFIDQEERNKFISKKVNKIFEKPLDQAMADTMASLFFEMNEDMSEKDRDYQISIDEEALLKRDLNRYDAGVLSIIGIESKSIKERLRKNPRLTKECGLIMGIMAIRPYEERDMKEIGQFLDNKKIVSDCSLYYLSKRDLSDEIQKKVIDLIGIDPEFDGDILMCFSGTKKIAPEIYAKIRQLAVTEKMSPSTIYGLIDKKSSPEMISFVMDFIRPEYYKDDGAGIGNYVIGGLIQHKHFGNEVVSAMIDKLADKSLNIDLAVIYYMKEAGEVDKSLQLKLLKGLDPKNLSHKVSLKDLKFSDDPEVQAALIPFK